MTDKEFIIYIQKQLPTRSRLDEGVNFNLQKIHSLIKEYLETGDI